MPAPSSAKRPGPRDRTQSRPDNASIDGESSLTLRGLFETYYAAMWRLLRRLGVPIARIDDAAQEVFWVAARRLSDIRPGSEHAFLYGVALRVAANERRREQTAPQFQAADIAELRHDGASPEEMLEQRRARQLLDEVLNRLPFELRSVLVLFELEGFEVQEIAELEDIPNGTVASRLRRARAEFSAAAGRVRASLTSESLRTGQGRRG